MLAVEKWRNRGRDASLDGYDVGGERSGFGFQAGRTGAIGDGRRREKGEVHIALFVANNVVEARCADLPPWASVS